MTVRDLRPLRHFVAVAEELHFGRAAARLYMTQPPLSQSIQALEQALGVTLFVRTNRTVSLTPAGALWLPYVRHILDEAERLPKIAERLSRGEIGTLRLGFVSSAVYSFLPDLIGRFSAHFPDVEIALQEATSDVQVQALLDNELDVGLLIAPVHRAFAPGLNYQTVWQEPLMVAMPQQWLEDGIVRLQASTESICLRDICMLPLLLFPRESAPALHDLITGYYEQLGLQPRLGQRAIQMQTIIGLVSAGLGFALVPQSLRNMQRHAVVYKSLLDNPPFMETGIVLHKVNAPAYAHHFAELASV